MLKLVANNQGFVDGVLGRASKNPYNYDQYKNFEAYTAGYLNGMDIRREHNIKITIERSNDDK